MGIQAAVVMDQNQNQPRRILPGDVMSGFDRLEVLNTVGAGTLTALLLTSGIVSREGAQVGAFSDTTASASEIIALALQNYFVGAAVSNGGNGASGGIQDDTTFMLRYMNTTGQTATILAGAGVTLSGTMTIATQTVREFLIKILCGTPAQIFTGATTNASAVVTNLTMSQTNRLTPGMLVTGTGIQAGTIVLGVNPGVGVTLSLPATSTGSAVSLTFSPRVSITNLGTNSI